MKQTEQLVLICQRELLGLQISEWLPRQRPQYAMNILTVQALAGIQISEWLPRQ